MYRIAFRGMRGRRKDTLLLLLVITLSFTLLISTALLHSSTQYTGQLQRLDAFGEWVSGVFGVTEKERVQLSGEAEEEETGRLRLIGTSDMAGLIGAADEKLLQMGHFTVSEGHLPEQKNEIAIEASRLAAYGENLKVGDTVLVVTSVNLSQMSRSEISQERVRIMAEDPAALRLQEECREKYPEETLPKEDGYFVYYYIWNAGNFEEPPVITAEIADVILDENGKLKEEITTEDCPAEKLSYFRRYWSILRLGYESMYVDDYEAFLQGIVSNYLWGSYGWVSRTEYSGEGDDEMHSRTRTEYVGPTRYDGEMVKGMDDFLSHAFVTKRAMELKREMTICGILTDYSSDWDTGTYEMPSALITEETGYAYLEEGLYQLEPIREADYEVPQYLFFSRESEAYQGSGLADSLSEKWGDRFHYNESAYPEGSGSTEQVLTYSILIFILVATLFSVFQIFLIQMRRRTRRLALLKAIGMTNRQVAQLLLWEGILLLVPGFLLGAVLSFAVLTAAKMLLPVYTEAPLFLYCDGGLLLFGILGGCLAVLAGMSIPGVMALRVPLTGSIQIQAGNRRGGRTRTAREILKQRRGQEYYQKQSLRAVERRHRQFTRGQNGMLQTLYTILISVVLGSLLLGFLAFYEYTRKVVLTDRPEYELRQSYSLSTRTAQELTEELSALPGVERVETWRKGSGAYLWFDGITESELIGRFRALLPESLRSVHFYDEEPYVDRNSDSLAEPYLVKEALRTDLYAVEAGTEMYSRLLKAAGLSTAGETSGASAGGNSGQAETKAVESSWDVDAYEAGEQVILLVPLVYEGRDVEKEITRYTAENLPGGTTKENRMSMLLEAARRYELSYSELNADYYGTENLVQPGDKLTLTVPTEELDPVASRWTYEIRQCSVEVGAVISYFPEKGIWPFSEEEECYAVIGSDALYRMLYPYVESDFGEKDEQGELAMSAGELATYRTLYPTRYGEMDCSVYTDGETDRAFVEMGIRNTVSGYFFTVDGLHMESSRIYNRALRQAAMVALIAFAAVLITLVVLYNMRLSKLEQERERIGILQSLGVTGRELRQAAAGESFSYGLRALVVAHFLVLVILVTTSLVQTAELGLTWTDFLQYILTDRLLGYPWVAHGLICLGFLAMVYLIHCLPLRKYERCQPVENIRSQGH